MAENAAPVPDEEDDGRGRRAVRPGEIPMRGWKDIAFRVKDELSEDNLSIVAAGVAFFALLALFPAIAALVSLYGLVFDPSQVGQQLATITNMMPSQAAAIVLDQAKQFASNPSDKLGVAALVGFAFTLWSATAGTKTLFSALNIVYEEHETRGFIRFNLLALCLTLGGLLFAVIAFAGVIVLPIIVNFVGLGGVAEVTITGLTWVMLACCVIFALGVIYRYGPDRRPAQWRWLSWGSVGATILWLIASILFSFYVSNFGNYDKTYGSLGAIVILMMWIYISAYLILVGGEVNAEIEHQTAVDTTTGPPRPRGKRGAYVADTVGAAKTSH